MRNIVLSSLLLGALQLAGGTAQARDYPWCAWYNWTVYNCGFDTIQQCLATVSGAGGMCRPNQWYRPPPRRSPRRTR
jgi:hypothetical protein